MLDFERAFTGPDPFFDMPDNMLDFDEQAFTARLEQLPKRTDRIWNMVDATGYNPPVNKDVFDRVRPPAATAQTQPRKIISALEPGHRAKPIEID